MSENLKIARLCAAAFLFGSGVVGFCVASLAISVATTGYRDDAAYTAIWIAFGLMLLGGALFFREWTGKTLWSALRALFQNITARPSTPPPPSPNRPPV